MFYSKTVIDHFMNPRNIGPLPGADGLGTAESTTCDDVTTVWITLNGTGIDDIAFQTKGCSAATWE